MQHSLWTEKSLDSLITLWINKEQPCHACSTFSHTDFTVLCGNDPIYPHKILGSMSLIFLFYWLETEAWSWCIAPIGSTNLSISNGLGKGPTNLYVFRLPHHKMLPFPLTPVLSHFRWSEKMEAKGLLTKDVGVSAIFTVPSISLHFCTE